MNKILKFLPAALTAIALSSCSNDDLFDGFNEETQGNVLKVTVETPVDDLTRAANVADGNALIWERGDVITVYDNNLFKYDPYTFNTAAKAFVKADSKTAITTPAYALFPERFFNSSNTHWDRETNVVYAFANIAAQLKYGAPYYSTTYASDAYVANDGNPAYRSNLPLWGTASTDGETTSASLKYTTAILKVKLTNAMGNAKYLYVRGFSDLAGTQPAQLNGQFKLTMSDSEGNALSSSALEPAKGTTLNYEDNYLEINISNISKATSYIYVPVPVGHYGKLQIWTQAAQIDQTTYKAGDPINHAIASGDLVQEYVDKTFEVKFYATGNAKEYNIDATTTQKITALLNASKDEAGAKVTINGAANPTTLSSSSAGKTITLPNMQADVVELNLHSFNGAVAAADVEINGDEFTKTFVLNLTKAGSNLKGVTVNLPNGNIVLVGDYNDKAVTINAAKAVTIGDGSTTTSCAGTTTILAEVYGPLSVKAKATAGALELPENHRISSVDIAGTAASLTVKAATQNDCTIDVSGAVTGAITNEDAGKITLTGNCGSIKNETANIEISGAPNYTGTYAKVATVDTKGDVTVNLSNEGAAIGSSLDMAAGKTLTLTQGYIKAITVPSSGDNVTIALGNDNKFKTVPTITGSKFTVTGTTIWNGKKIGDGIPVAAKTAVPDDATKTTITTAWQGYADSNSAVYTAMGFVHNMITSAEAVTLANNIDLGNQKWTPATSAGVFTGNGKTISNLKIEDFITKKANKANGLGLFASLGHNVTNVIIDGVTISQALAENEAISNVGALAGKTSAAAVLTAVTVKNVSIEVKGKDATAEGAKAIGGVIGLAGGKVTMTGVQLAGTANTIKGYSKMGGLIGDATGQTVTIQKKAKDDAPKTDADVKSSVSNLSFIANYNSATTDPAIDVNYLSVGNFIGKTDGSAQITITDADNIAANNLNKNTDAFVGGIMKYVDGVNFRDYVFGQGLIGYCGDVALSKAPKINGKDYNVQTTKAAFDALTGDNKSLYYINK